MDCEYTNNPNSKPDVLPVCRLCLEVSPITLYPTKCLDMCLTSIVPNLDLSLSKNPGVCINCTTILTNSYNLKMRCMNNQERIMNYYSTTNESVDLYDFVRCFGQDDVKTALDITSTKLKESLEDNKMELLDISAYTKPNALDQQQENVKETSNIVNTREKESPLNNKMDLPDISPFTKLNSLDLHNISNIGCKEELGFNGRESENQSLKARKETPNNNNKDQKIDTSKVLDMDEIVFNYTQEFQFSSSVAKNRAEISQDMENRSASEKPTSSRTLWKKIGPQRYQCLLCQKTFDQKINRDGHLLNKHKDFPNIEDIIESKLHSCDLCEYRTINTYNLTSHMLSKHDIVRSSKHKLERFNCFQCSYSTRNKGNLVLHARIHSCRKFFECKYCKKSFKQKCNLNNHYLRCHKEEIRENNIDSLNNATVYTCDVCQLKTLDKSRHKRHLKIHKLSNRREKQMD